MCNKYQQPYTWDNSCLLMLLNNHAIEINNYQTEIGVECTGPAE